MKVMFFCRSEARVEQLTLALRLRWPDLKPILVSNAREGLQAIEQQEPDLAMLCGDLSDMNMWRAIKEIRSLSNVPLIVAAEDKSEMQVVKAIDLGADDYIPLPCNLMIITARVVALMRREGINRKTNEDTRIHCGDMLIDPAVYEAYLGDRRLLLTPTEFRLLHLLAKNRHMTVTQGLIQKIIWSDETNAGDTVKKYVQRLRRKLGDDARSPIWIKTVHGIGYRLTPPDVANKHTTAVAV